MKVGIIDHGAGNLQSVKNALEFLQVEFGTARGAGDFSKFDKFILPGVGHAATAMKNLQAAGLTGPIRNTQKPFLGICLGMQLLFEFSTEGNTPCLGIFPGKVERFNFPPSARVPVPHMGFNAVEFSPQFEKMTQGIGSGSDFYFVHSFFCQPKNPGDVLGQTEFAGIKFCSAVAGGNFLGVQFHPEKSGSIGLKFLQNFLCKPDS